MANTYLTRTFGTDNSTVYKWTYSFWVKRSKLGSSQTITSPYVDANNLGWISFLSSDALEIYDYQISNGGYKMRKVTTRLFRDTSAWYHIVIANDNSVASPDLKIYINGVQETSFSTDTEYDQNKDTLFNKNILNSIGRYPSAGYFDGSISHFHFIDGTAYDATAFGSTDATTGEWKINTSPSVTYGANGFFILKDTNSGTDQSGEGNNFTVGGGTLTKTEDCPSNVFATGNPLSSNVTMSNGNLTFSGTYNFKSTLAFSKGKYYAECKVTNSNTYNPQLGIGQVGSANIDNPAGTGYAGNTPNSYHYERDGKIFANANGTAVQTGLTTVAQNDIVGIAVDLDSATKTIKWYINGTLSATQNITETASEPYVFWTYASGSQAGEGSWNFGNGYFGTTAVSSAGTNASGIGIFEYDVPTGYTALSTKGLNL